MRRLSMRAKKGKSDAHDSENEVDSSGEQENQKGNGGNNTSSSDDESNEDKQDSADKKSKRSKKIESGSQKSNEDDSQRRKKRGTSKMNMNSAGEEEEEEEPENYEVDSVVDDRLARGKRQFKIRWKGYGPENDTWEPEDKLSCPDLIKKYLESNVESKGKNKDKGKKRGKTDDAKKKKRKSDESKGDYSADGEEDEPKEQETEVYEVDRVMEVHFKRNGKRDFLIHWKGFRHEDDTWEPEENLNCPDLIEKFMGKVEKARSASSRELRINPQHTDRFTLNMGQQGRRLSRRNQGRQRATYHSFV